MKILFKVISRFYYLLVFSFMLGCYTKYSKHIEIDQNTIIYEGIGLNQIKLNNLNRDSLIKYLGKDFIDSEHHFSLNEMRYEKMGISFFSLSKAGSSTISSISINKHFLGKTACGFIISKMTFSDVLKIYGNPCWTFSKDSKELVASYNSLGIEFYVDRIFRIPDSIPTAYPTHDIFINRLLFNYFRDAYGNSQVKNFTIKKPRRDIELPQDIGLSVIDSVFKIKLKTNIDLLNKRISLKFPEPTITGTKYVEYEKYGQKFTIKLTDLQCYASINMMEDIKSFINKRYGKNYNFRVLHMIQQTIMYVVEPSSLRIDDDCNYFLVKSVFIQNTDNSIVYLEMFINTNAWSNRKNYLDLANKIVNSIRSGTGRLNIKREDIIIEFGKNKIFVKKPEGIIYSYEIGACANTIRFKNFSAFQTPCSNLMIRQGSHLNFFYTRDIKNLNIVTKIGKLFGQNVELNYCYNKNRKDYPFSIEGINYEKSFHFYFEVYSQEDYNAYRTMLPDSRF